MLFTIINCYLHILGLKVINRLFAEKSPMAKTGYFHTTSPQQECLYKSAKRTTAVSHRVSRHGWLVNRLGIESVSDCFYARLQICFA